MSGNRKIWFKKLKNDLHIQIANHFDNAIPVIKIKFKEKFEIQSSNAVTGNLLKSENAIPIYGFSTPDYYSGYKTIIQYDWTVKSKIYAKNLELKYTENLIGKEILLKIDNHSVIERKLYQDKISSISTNRKNIVFKNTYYKKGYGIFGYLENDNQQKIEVDKTWNLFYDFKFDSSYSKKVNDRESIVILQKIETKKTENILLNIDYGNGFILLLNGQYVTANFDLERKSHNKTKVLLPLLKDENQIIIKFYNRDAKLLQYGISPEWNYSVMHQTISNINLNSNKSHKISLKLNKPASKVMPIELNNLQIELTE